MTPIVASASGRFVDVVHLFIRTPPVPPYDRRGRSTFSCVCQVALAMQCSDEEAHTNVRSQFCKGIGWAGWPIPSGNFSRMMR